MLNARASFRRSEQCESVLAGEMRNEDGKMDGNGVVVSPFAVEDR